MSKYEKCTITEPEGKREYYNMGGVWYKELMSEGEWGLYEIAEELYSLNRRKFDELPRKFAIIHSRIYKRTRPLFSMEMPVKWCGKDDEDKDTCTPVTHATETYDAVCNTILYPSSILVCDECGAHIPEKFVTVWRLMNPDSMDQTR